MMARKYRDASGQLVKVRGHRSKAATRARPDYFEGGIVQNKYYPAGYYSAHDAAALLLLVGAVSAASVDPEEHTGPIDTTNFGEYTSPDSGTTSFETGSSFDSSPSFDGGGFGGDGSV